MHVLEIIFNDVLPGKEPSVNPVLTVKSAGEVLLREYLIFNTASQRMIGIAPGIYDLSIESVGVFNAEIKVPEIDHTIISVEAPASILYAQDIDPLN